MLPVRVLSKLSHLVIQLRLGSKIGKSRKRRDRESIPSEWLLGQYLHLSIILLGKKYLKKTPVKKDEQKTLKKY